MQHWLLEWCSCWDAIALVLLLWQWLLLLLLLLWCYDIMLMFWHFILECICIQSMSMQCRWMLLLLLLLLILLLPDWYLCNLLLLLLMRLEINLCFLLVEMKPIELYLLLWLAYLQIQCGFDFEILTDFSEVVLVMTNEHFYYVVFTDYRRLCLLS